jgi:RIO kinase 2
MFCLTWSLRSHRYFDRDIECIRTFFRRKFNYESRLYPKFARDTEREFELDVQVAASGFSKKHQKEFEELSKEFGVDENGDSEADSDEESEEFSDESEEEEEEEDDEAADDDANGTTSPSDIAFKIQAIALDVDGDDGDDSEEDSDTDKLEANVNLQSVPYRDAPLPQPAATTREGKLDPNAIRARLVKGASGGNDRSTGISEKTRNHAKGRHRGQNPKQRIKDVSNYTFD